MPEYVYQFVTCKQCGRRYECTPSDDYYNATTAEDGVCEQCLLGGLVLVEHEAVYERCVQCGHEYRFPHLCRQHLLCGFCHPPMEETR